MKKMIVLLLPLICYLHSDGQNTSNVSFLQQKRNIDSLAKLVDDNKEYIERSITGSDSTYGEFTSNYLYNRKDKFIYKMEYTFTSDAGVKVFYYNKDSLMKVIDNGTTLYFIGSALQKELGKDVTTKEGMHLLLFQNNFKRLAKMIMNE